MTRPPGAQAHYLRLHMQAARRRWEAREGSSGVSFSGGCDTPQNQRSGYGHSHFRGWSIEALRQCPSCGFGHTGPPAGGNGPLCRRCGGDLTPSASTQGWATVLIGHP
jgi:hypothetical protein